MTTASRRTAFAAMLILVAVSVTAQTINLVGTVTNKMGKPVIGASVSLASDSLITATTDSSGQFLLKREQAATVRKRSVSSSPSVTFFRESLRLVTTQASPVIVTIFSTSGRKVAEHSFFIATPGTHLVTLPANNRSTGYYLVQVDIAGNRTVSGYFPSLSRAGSVASGERRSAASVSASATIAQIVDDTIIVRAPGYGRGTHAIASYQQTDLAIILDPVSRLVNITRSCDGLTLSIITGGQKGWGSRYWDCCKPHCSSTFNTTRLAANCGKNGVDEVPCFVEEKNEWDSWNKATESGCLNGPAYACYRHVPFAVCEKLAYGYAAVPSGDDACGKCFQLDFDGGAHNGDVKEAHQKMKGKTLIVIASNIGHDVSGGQFDLMIPGGGLGQFRDGCKNQWGVDVNDEKIVGKTYGGLISTCQDKHGWDAPLDDLKGCVRGMCDNLFGKDPALHDLWEGCIWYVDWMNAVDNPTFTFKEVPCPKELVDIYYSTEHPRP